LSFKASLAAGLAALAVVVLGGPAAAQIALPRLPGAPAVLPSLPMDRRDLDRTAQGLVDRALQAPARLQDLIRRSDGALEADPFGWPVVAGEVVAVGLSDPGRAEALRSGFTIVREDRMEALDLSVTVLAPPRRLSLSRAVERLRALDPAAEITFNHVHAPAGGAASVEDAAAVSTAVSAGPVQASGARLGLIDTGVNPDHPALAGSRITQRGFAGAPRPGAHGVAVASLMVGRSGGFAGADPGGALLVADVFGAGPAGGASTALAQALAWMVEQRVAVVNVSLVGPRNALIERAVARARARGLVLVAAAGNDGPAAAVLFPAGYDGVVGVTAVNARNQLLPETPRGAQVDFAAPGSDMAAAGVQGGYVSVRGTSFAAPLVAGLLARSGGGEASVQALARSAADLGARGRDAAFGLGLVGADLRIAPSAVGARGRLRR
jgi:subtilisin family serine protease